VLPSSAEELCPTPEADGYVTPPAIEQPFPNEDVREALVALILLVGLAPHQGMAVHTLEHATEVVILHSRWPHAAMHVRARCIGATTSGTLTARLTNGLRDTAVTIAASVGRTSNHGSSVGAANTISCGRHPRHDVAIPNTSPVARHGGGCSSDIAALRQALHAPPGPLLAPR
jgi:hypothetical protein